MDEIITSQKAPYLYQVRIELGAAAGDGLQWFFSWAFLERFIVLIFLERLNLKVVR